MYVPRDAFALRFLGVHDSAEVPPIRLVLADDHETVREGLKAIFSAHEDVEVVGEASDGQGAVALAHALRPTIVIMDVSMLVLNGLKATEEIVASCPEVKVLVLSRHANEGFGKQLLHAGPWLHAEAEQLGTITSRDGFLARQSEVNQTKTNRNLLAGGHPP